MTGAAISISTERNPAPVERDVVIVTFDAAQIIDVTGPLEVFSSFPVPSRGQLPHPGGHHTWWPGAR